MNPVTKTTFDPLFIYIMILPSLKFEFNELLTKHRVTSETVLKFVLQHFGITKIIKVLQFAKDRNFIPKTNKASLRKNLRLLH